MPTNPPQLWTHRLSDFTGIGGGWALPFASSDPPETTFRFADTPMPIGARLRNFRIDRDLPPGLGNTITYTIWRGPLETALLVTLADLETSKTIPGVDEHWARFEMIAMRSTGTGSPTLSPFTYSIECEPDIAGQRAYGGGCLDFLTTGGQGKQNPFFPQRGTWGQYTLPLYIPVECLVGCPGVIPGFLALYQLEITDLGQYLFMLWKNGVAQDGTGGTVDTRTYLDRDSLTLTDAHGSVRSCAVGSFALPVTTLDHVFMTAEIVTESAQTGLRGKVTLSFEAADVNKFFLSGSAGGFGLLSTYYFQPVGTGVLLGTTEANRAITVGPFGDNGLKLSGFHDELHVAPGVNQGRQFMLRHAGADTDVDFAIEGDEVIGSDEGEVLVADGETFGGKQTAIGSPADNEAVFFTFVGEQFVPLENPETGRLVIRKVCN